MGNLDNFLNININTISSTEYNNLKSGYLSNLNSAGLVVGTNNSGIFANFVNLLNDIPEYAAPTTKPDLLDYAQALLSPKCWGSTGINNLRTDSTHISSNEEIWHMEHVLAQYLWSQDSSDANYSDGGTITIQTENGTETITNTSGEFGLSSGGGDGDDDMKVRDVLKKPENAELKTKLEQLYYQLALHIETNGTQGGLTSGTITNTSGNSPLSGEEIGQKYLELINELLVAVANDILEAGPSDPRYSQLGTYTEDLEKYNNYINFKNEFPKWVKNARNAVNEFEDYINSIPPKQIPDENNSKYQWYKNLWYRMGGINEKEKDDSGRHYKELDPNLLNNAEWLEFAFEHGIVTLEQAQYTEKGSAVYPNMGNYDWTSIIYTSAADIVSVEDEAAIARAEVEYENTVRDIENEDKKIDQDLKKLDTEHNALQTEYDSIKSVIDKNVERSFKTFS